MNQGNKYFINLIKPTFHSNQMGPLWVVQMGSDWQSAVYKVCICDFRFDKNVFPISNSRENLGTR